MRYAVIAPLGSGAYGCVYKCLDRDTGSLCALKVINLAHQEPAVMRLTMREVRTLQKLPKHPHIVELKDAFKSSGSGRVFLVFSCEGRSMHEEAENYAKYILPGPMLRQVAWQLLQALAHIHEHQIIHRDVKPGNILLVGDGTGGAAGVGLNGADVHIRLADFGFARSWQPHEALSSYVATRWFRAPEILVRGKYSFNSDCWSVGCTIAELAVGSALFPGTSTIDQLARIMRATGPLPPSLAAQMMSDRTLSPLAAQQRRPPNRTLRERLPVEARLFEFLAACLQVDPARRPSAKELMQMPYFWDIVPRSRALPKASMEAMAAARDAAAVQIAAAEATIAKPAAQPAAVAVAAPAAAARKDVVQVEAKGAAAAPAACGAVAGAAAKSSGTDKAAAGGAGGQTASSSVAAPMTTTRTASEAQAMSLSAVACCPGTDRASTAVPPTAPAQLAAAPAQGTAAGLKPATSVVISVKATAACGRDQPSAPMTGSSLSTRDLASMNPAAMPAPANSQGSGVTSVPASQAAEQAAAAPSAEPPPRVVCMPDLTSVSTLASGAAGPQPAQPARARAPAPVADASPEDASPRQSRTERELQRPQAAVTLVTSSSLFPSPLPAPLPPPQPVAVEASSPFTLVVADTLGGAAAGAAGAAAPGVAGAVGGDSTPRSHTTARMLDLPSNTVEMFISPTTSVAMHRLLPAVMTPVGAPPPATPSAAVRLRQLMPHCRAPAGAVPPVLTYGMLSRSSTLELDMTGSAAAAAAVAAAGVWGGDGGASGDGYGVSLANGASAGQLQAHIQMQQQAAQRHAPAAAANRAWRRAGRASVEFADQLSWPANTNQPDQTVSGASTSSNIWARAVTPGAGAARVGGSGGAAATGTRNVTSAAIMRRSWRLLPYRTTGGSPGFMPVPTLGDEPAADTPSLHTSGAGAVASLVNAAAGLGRHNSRSQASFVRSMSRMSQCHAMPSGALDVSSAGHDSSVDGAGGFCSAYAMANASAGATSSPLVGLVTTPQQPAKAQQLQAQLQRNGSTVGGAVAQSPPMLYGLVLAASSDSPSRTRRAASAVLPSFPAASVPGAHATPVTYTGASAADASSKGPASVAAAAMALLLRSSSQQQRAATAAGHVPHGTSRLANAVSSNLCDYPSGDADIAPTAGTPQAGASASAFPSGTPMGTATDSGAVRRALGLSWQVLQAVGCSSNAAAAASTACFDSAASATVAMAQAGAVSLDAMLATGGGDGGGAPADCGLTASASAVARFPSASLLTAGGGAANGAYVPHAITEEENELAYAAAADASAAGEAMGAGCRAKHVLDNSDGCVRLAGSKDTAAGMAHLQQSATTQHPLPARTASPGGRRQGAHDSKQRPGLLARLFGCGRFRNDQI
ncbi:hypothetical protein CHLRE_16g684400v5 [Chlamydomonas reinhardtii]|uniref:Protein kinase domain-containing protein n=1 Tax=Chlamydomonas reinhardtii TaxID=3055 RepID=A0A2K3CUU4_CHLRE|nr:uncharacterized protein CHLRE_16g684400v5 [Chlamydomonas reinhardtii]PNW72050.1 hypothetical protein CHLRE_16g684400v5 [Chlamydomonas reinhardtii]